MNWIVVKKFSLETDLSHISGYLAQCKIAHRIYEEAGEQIIATDDPRMVGAIARLLQELERGTLILQCNELDDAETAHIDDKQSPTFRQQLKAVPVTVILILCSIVGYLLIVFDSQHLLVRYLSYQDAYQSNIPSFQEIFNAGQPWRLITPTFLHFSFMHIFFNVLGSWDLGGRLELLLGKINYLLFFIVSAILSNLAQFLWHPNIFFGGISGVVYAFIGFIMISHKIAPHRLTALHPGELAFALFWLILCVTGVLDSFIGGGVANAAHLGGLFVGCAYAWITVKPAPAKV
ncbi:rhomboid family intramembrane serine protease [Cellvibrio zantedeschiae]|uniref:Rhomboid family intramembrane serine protease n=1 Tax=Cellvibrio zantedeschiae TaxID=1237077 RepID=A0ABQ3AVG5_9GAMM|nr:rhomboid family intramembrane serine protease [Cellvibrio zantedeschiae]GGY67629.1 rhomboid family intramembrane serine protease [Cellvibrio zantedeschiae]